jgi:hypothetical protein
LQRLGIVTTQNPIVESLKSDSLLRQLPFSVFVSVEAELGVVGEVRAELQKEGSKVAVHAVDVEVVQSTLARRERGEREPSGAFAVRAKRFLAAAESACTTLTA